MIFVKMGKEGERVQEFAFEGGIKVESALIKCGISMQNANDIIMYTEEGCSIPNEISKDSVLTKNCLLIIKKKIKNINIRIGKIGQTLIHVHPQEGSNINVAIEMTNIRIDIEKEDIWVHRDNNPTGIKRGLYHALSDGDIIVIEPKVTPKKELIDYIDEVTDGAFEPEELKEIVERIVLLAKRI